MPRTTHRIGTVACMLGVLVLAAQSCFAQDAPADGRTCFCLEHAPTQQVQSGCTGIRHGEDFFVTATCTGSDGTGTPTIVTVQPPWSVVLAGKPGCTPCRPPPRPTATVPRHGPDEP